MARVTRLLGLLSFVVYCGCEEVAVVALKGEDYSELGREYGTRFSQELASVYNILHKFYVIENHIRYERLANSARMLYDRYENDNYRRFIQGMAAGAGLSLEKTIIINGMEGLGKLVLGCSYLYVPPERSSTGQGIVGRNYDFPPPFNLIVQHLSVTVLDDQASLPVALISFIGEVMCLTCVNTHNLFISLNNGMPSGGFEVNDRDATILGTLLDIARTIDQPQHVHTRFPPSCRYDYSTILNFANGSHVESFEVSTRMGCRQYSPPTDKPFVSTNCFQNDTWPQPMPSDENSWNSHTRKHNLHNLLSQPQQLAVSDVLQAMDVSLSEGGAKWEPTLFQVVYDFASRRLYIRRPHIETAWKQIDLTSAFASLGTTYIGLTPWDGFGLYVLAVMPLVLFLRYCLSVRRPSPSYSP